MFNFILEKSLLYKSCGIWKNNPMPECHKFWAVFLHKNANFLGFTCVDTTSQLRWHMTPKIHRAKMVFKWSIKVNWGYNRVKEKRNNFEAIYVPWNWQKMIKVEQIIAIRTPLLSSSRKSSICGSYATLLVLS